MRRYNLKIRDNVTYVCKERYQSLREAVNAFLHSEKVELPHAPDESFEFSEQPQGVPDDFTDTNFDRMEAAASISKKPNREAAKTGVQASNQMPELESIAPAQGGANQPAGDQ